MSHIPDSGMPPVHEREPIRIQVSTRLLLSLDDRIRVFAKQHRTTMQAVHEAALDEYMRKRGG